MGAVLELLDVVEQYRAQAGTDLMAVRDSERFGDWRVWVKKTPISVLSIGGDSVLSKP
jgi:hypothetical protein